MEKNLEKNKTRTLSNTIHKAKLKMDYRFKHKAKTPRGEHRQNTLQNKSIYIKKKRKLSTEELMLLNCGVGEDS